MLEARHRQIFKTMSLSDEPRLVKMEWKRRYDEGDNRPSPDVWRPSRERPIATDPGKNPMPHIEPVADRAEVADDPPLGKSYYISSTAS